MTTVASVRRHARHGLVDLHHRGREADHLGLRHLFLFGFLLAAFAYGLGALDGIEHDVEIEGLGDVVERAAARGGHHGFDGAAPGHENYGTVGIVALGGIEHVEAGALIDVDIGNDDGIFAIAQPLDGFAGGGYRIHRIALLFERGENRKLQAGIVFD